MTPDGAEFMTFVLRFLGDTTFVLQILDFTMQYPSTHLARTVDFDTVHKHFGDPSREVLRQARKHTKDFPYIEIPTNDPICPGCAQGKMTNCHFPPSNHRATCPFQLIHSDLKTFPVISYYRQKYIITFYNDFTSYGWISALTTKDKAIQATKHFLAFVENQFHTAVQMWMSDGEGEYKSMAFDDLLKNRGIRILQSAPYIPQQNGHAEQFMRTLSNKVECMRFGACIPQSWWNFSYNQAYHVYNHTPQMRLNWRTPYEVLEGEKPCIEHLRVFGCGAYVHIPQAVQKDKLCPKSKLMTYIGIAPGDHGNIFMCSLENVVFTSAHADFNENLFPRCPANKKQDQIPSRPAKTPLLNPDGPSDDDEDTYHHTPYPSPNRKHEKDQGRPDDDQCPHTTAQVPDLPPSIQDGEERYQMGENTLPPRRNPPQVRTVPRQPGNIYGEQRHPIDQLNMGRWSKRSQNQERTRQTESTDATEQQQVPGPSHATLPDEQPSGNNSTPVPVDENPPNNIDEGELAHLCREGRVKLFNHLIKFEYSLNYEENESTSLEHGPDLCKVWEWQFKDIAKIKNPNIRKEFECACQEELEALWRRGTFERVKNIS